MDPAIARRRWVMLGVLFLARTALGFQFQSVAVVGPFLLADLGLSHAQLGWLIGLYLLPGAAIALPAGLLGQRFGARRVVLAALVLMIGGGLLAAASGSFAEACVWRTLSGVGGVLLNVLVTRLLADWFEGREITTAIGVTLPAWPAGIALALLALGPVAVRWSWRASLGLTALAAALALGLMLIVYRDPPPRPVAPARLRPSLPPRDWALSVAAGLAWGAFNAGVVILWSFGPALLIAQGASVAAAGFLVSLSLWVRPLTVPLSGYLVDRVGRPGLAIGVGALGTALAIAALPLLPVPALWLVLTGVLGAPPTPALNALLPRALRPDRLSAGLGVYYTVYFVSAAALQPVAGWARDLSDSPAVPIYLGAAIMALTVLPVALFRALERAWPAEAGVG